MKRWLASIAVVSLQGNSAAAAELADCLAALDFHQRPLPGDKPVYLYEAFRGQVVLAVNTGRQICVHTAIKRSGGYFRALP